MKTKERNLMAFQERTGGGEPSHGGERTGGGEPLPGGDSRKDSGGHKIKPQPIGDKEVKDEND